MHPLRTWPFSKTGAEQEKKGATWSIFSTTAMGYCIFESYILYSAEMAGSFVFCRISESSCSPCLARLLQHSSQVYL